MANKKINLDDATVRIMRRMLNTPPKPHEEMKVGRPANKKKRGPSRAEWEGGSTPPRSPLSF
jgi:hypothetical protein